MARENPISSETTQTRYLTVEREREIASILAFLAADTDDNLRGMGVCVEEYGIGKGITICIASNKGSLPEITSRFIELAKTLEHAARRGLVICPTPGIILLISISTGNSRLEDLEAVFRQIVALDFP
ncbi:hypothetical protein IFR04_008553 [Cadophora malorum]|uniref:Uncharacterized protein n=1 Tax=Cadophora malorum TaxID=108018 RepID=A0A8H7TFI6_9HELO|nr:hypothetical protein IFR04_008553 [Cadophora malorum]